MKIKGLVVTILAIMIAGLVVVSYSYANDLSITDTLKKIPAIKQGFAYNVNDSQFDYLSTVECLNYKGISLEAGYSYNDKVVGVLSYKLASAKDLGINVPIIDLLELNVGVYIGYSRTAIGRGNSKDNNEWSFGPSVTLIKVKY